MSGSGGSDASSGRPDSRWRDALRSKPGSAARRWTAVGAVTILGGASLLGACGNSPRSADDALAAAQAYVADATAFRFEANIETTVVTDASDFRNDELRAKSSPERDSAGGPGTTTTDRSVTKGAWTPDAWETTTDDSFGRSESKVVGATAYTRRDMGGEGQWVSYEFEEPSRQEMLDELESMREGMQDEDFPGGEYETATEYPGAATGLAASLYLSGEGLGSDDLFGDPTGFLGAIGDMSNPEIASRDGEAITVSATLSAPSDVEDAWGAPLPGGTMTLTVGRDGAPSRLTLTVGEDDDSIEVDLRFSEWNEPQEIVRPDSDEIDQTPWLDEEAVAAVPGVSLVTGDVPDGWELDYVNAVSGDESAEGCDQVEIYWSPMISDDEDAEISDDYVDLYLLPQACAMEGDPTPFAVGPYAPLPSREGPYVVEVLVGNTVVQIDTTLTGEELSAFITSLRPIDLETLSAAMDQDSWSSIQTA